MKLTKTASGKRTLKLSKKEWQSIGKKAGWTKSANSNMSLNQFMNVVRRYTHYDKTGESRFTLVNASECENCRGRVEEPNSVSVQCPERLLTEAGLQYLAGEALGEPYPCEECGGTYCSSCQCSHGEETGITGSEGSGVMIQPGKLTNDELIRMAEGLREKTVALREYIQDKEMPNIRYMTSIGGLVMFLRMMSHSENIDKGFADQFNDAARILTPIGQRCQRNFMAKPSAKSRKEIASALDKIEPIIEVFLH